MEYTGKLYAKIAGKYIPLDQTAEDIDKEIKSADAQAGRLMRENEELRDTLTKWRDCNDKRKLELGYDRYVSFDTVYADLVKIKNEYELNKNIRASKERGTVSLTTLFEIQSFHGDDALILAVKSMLAEHKKTMKFPHPVCANNGDDTVYIHEDGSQTWNNKEKKV